MPIVWTVDGNENSWSDWANTMAQSPASPLATELIKQTSAKQNKIALDIGCGSGRAFSPLYHAGFQIVGIDPIMTGLRFCQDRCAKENLAASVICSPASHIPFQSSSFDFAVAIGVLFHLSPCELDLTLQAIKRVMKPNGEAILHFLGFQDWRKSLARTVQPEQVPVPSYKAVVTSFRSQDKVKDCLTLNGLKIASIELITKKTEKGTQQNYIAYCMRD